MDKGALATIAPPSTPLVGRAEPLALLRGLADQVRTERTVRIATVFGPRGVGKTRLTAELLDDLSRHEDSEFRVFRGVRRPGRSAAGPVIGLLRHRFGVEGAGSLDAMRSQVRARMADVFNDRRVGDVCHVLGRLLEIPFPDTPLTNAVVEDRSLSAWLLRVVVAHFFERDAASHSAICLAFDDLELATDEELDIVAHSLEHLVGPILVLCAAEPELLRRRSDWCRLGEDRHTRLDLGPLGEASARELLSLLLAPCEAEGGAPTELVDTALSLSAGNPTLLRSTITVFHDVGVLEELPTAGAPLWRAHPERLADAVLPATAEDRIAMRIAALSADERRILEQAAAMGESFWRGALGVLARLDGSVPPGWEDLSLGLEEIDTLLASLEQRKYVVRTAPSAIAGEAEYSFRNGSEREYVLRVAEPARLRKYHSILVDWLTERRGSSAARSHDALVAYHLEHAGQKLEAGLLCLDVADAAREAYAAQEADKAYRRGFALLGEDKPRRRIDALHNHGDVLLVLGHTDQALGAFREMLELAYRLDLKAKGGAAHNRIGRLYRTIGSLSEATEHLETALRLFEAVGDERGVAACHDDVGKLLWTQGDYENALLRMKQSLDMRKAIGDRRSIALSLHNIGVVWRDHGQPIQAAEAFEASLGIRRELGDLTGVAQTLNSMGRLAQDQHKLEKARDLYRQAYEVAMEVGEQNRIALVLTNLGEVLYQLGESEEAIRILEDVEELCDHLGNRLHLAEAKRGLAEAYLVHGELKKARTSIKHAVDLFGQVRSKSHLASALRTLGDITAAGAWGPTYEGRAVDYFMRSIALCKEIGNELEIAKSYRSFSDYVARSHHYKENLEIQREAQKLREMADEIFARQRSLTESAEAGS